MVKKKARGLVRKTQPHLESAEPRRAPLCSLRSSRRRGRTSDALTAVREGALANVLRTHGHVSVNEVHLRPGPCGCACARSLPASFTPSITPLIPAVLFYKI